MKTFKKALGTINSDAAAKLVTLSTDIAVMVDNRGIVRDFSIGNESLSRESDFASWIGLPWIDTVTADSRPKIEQLLKDAASQQGTRWRQVNHTTPGGTDSLPVRYAAIQLGRNGQVVALGRELRAMSLLQKKLVDAQQAMEREYARVRSAETRYRLLFQLLGEPVVILEAASLRIVEVNPAAAGILGPSPKRTVGRPFLDFLDAASATRFQDVVSVAKSAGKAAPIQITLASDDNPYLLSASLFRQESISHLLVRFAPARAVSPAPRPQGDLKSVVDKIPDAFALVGSDQRILTVNSAFLDLAQLASHEMAEGELLERWIGRSSIDLGVLMNSVEEHGSARHFSTIARGEQGYVEDVEISAVAVPDGEPPCYGLTMRPVGRRLGSDARTGEDLPRSVKQLTGLVGQVPLKNLIRETTDLIERLCIEAALEIVGDNRATAAEILGLSRQSLYVKMRRYGLGDLDS